MSTDPQPAPVRSAAQRLDALGRANDVRSRRARLKEDHLRAAQSRSDALQRAASVLAQPPGWLETMKVYDLLKAIPSVGPVKASKLLKLSSMSPSKTVGGASDRQRAQLIALLTSHAEECRAA